MRQSGITMRIGFLCVLSIHAAIAAVSTTGAIHQEVNVPRKSTRRSRKMIHDHAEISEITHVYTREHAQYKLSRSLGVGLDNMQYGKGKGQGPPKTKGEVKGKGYYTDDDGDDHEYDKAGKDDKGDKDTDDAEDIPSPITSPSLSPALSPVAPTTNDPSGKSPVWKDGKMEKKLKSKTGKPKLSKSAKKDCPTQEPTFSPVSPPSEEGESDRWGYLYGCL